MRACLRVCVCANVYYSRTKTDVCGPMLINWPIYIHLKKKLAMLPKVSLSNPFDKEMYKAEEYE